MKLSKVLLMLLCVGQSCLGQSNKINGVSFVASSSEINNSDVEPVINIGANYCALMPFGFIKSLDNPKVNYNLDRQWFGERKVGVTQYINTLRKNDVKIMMKPQLWVWHGEYTGFIEMQNEQDWLTFETSYKSFILDFARLAEEHDVEILCIGTELEKFVVNRPDYWMSLIKDIKAIYSGKITYAANWDEFKRSPFWNKLDYIGIDAYFPLNDSKTPTVASCREGWQPHKAEILRLSKKYDKPILFTEFGYRSMNYNVKEPWNSDRNLNSVNLVAQYNATEALFKTFWNEPWFAGGFIWKWHYNYKQAGGKDNSRFTPQNKPVEDVIRTYYTKQ